MRSRILVDDIERTFAVVFDEGDEVASGLLALARDENITAAHFTAIGALRDVKLGWFNLRSKDYEVIPLDEQVEVLSLVGNVAVHEGQPKVHAHLVVGKRDGTAHGGHLMEAHVRPTLEVMLHEAPKHLQRKTDSKTGLALIDLDARSQPHRRGRSVETETT